MEFDISASPDILGVVGPHHVAKNFGNTLCRKCRQQLQKLDFFGEKIAKIGIFDCSFWEGRGCTWSEIFFWGDPHWLGVKPHGRPKRRPGPSQPTGSRFWTLRIEKRHFFHVFNENLSFLVYFHRSAGRLRDTRNFFQQQVGQNIPIWGVQSKIRFFWRKNCKNWYLRLFILGGKGVRLVRNFFLGWSTLVSSNTPWQTKNTFGTSPAHWESILTSQDRKKAFFPSF